jgi:hypothetical protein
MKEKKHEKERRSMSIFWGLVAYSNGIAASPSTIASYYHASLATTTPRETSP